MVQERQQEIVNELLNYMDTLEDGSEVRKVKHQNNNQ